MADRATANDPTRLQRSARAPLDPYVEQVLRWMSSQPDGVPAIGLARAIANEFEWSAPFADVVLTSLRARRLLRAHRLSSRSLNLGLSRRAEVWLSERSDNDLKEQAAQP